MNMLERLLVIKLPRLLSLAVITVTLPGPAVLAIALHAPEFFERTDFAKLLLVAAGLISFPLAFFWLTAFGIMIGDDPNSRTKRAGRLSESDHMLMLSVASAATFVAFAGACAIRLIFGAPHPELAAWAGIAMVILETTVLGILNWWCTCDNPDSPP